MALVILDCEIYLSQGKLDHSCLDVNLLHLDNLHTYVFASFLEMTQIESSLKECNQRSYRLSFERGTNHNNTEIE